MTIHKTHWQTHWQTYRKLEQTINCVEQSFLQRFIEQLQQTNRRIVQWFTPSEPIIQQVKQRNGRVGWRVHDPNTQRSAYLTSEEETLAWLDEGFADRQADSTLNRVDLYRSQAVR
jgi:hypothetical protein